MPALSSLFLSFLLDLSPLPTGLWELKKMILDVCSLIAKHAENIFLRLFFSLLNYYSCEGIFEERGSPFKSNPIC